jgi:arylsulfatase A-like enzyme
VFVHFPIPHAPYFYDRSTGGYTLRNSLFSGYVDALELVDRTLAELRQTMQQAGTWDNTTVLITSDHSHREAARRIDGKMDNRVPFLVRFAGERSGLEYERPFNALAAHELILAILRREVVSAADAARWLERHPYPPGGLADQNAAQ